MKVYTACYKNCNHGYAIDTCSSKESIEVFYPTSSWEEIISCNKDISLERLLALFVFEYYDNILKPFNKKNIFKYIKDGLVLLSKEDETEVSHRHILAAYLELFYDIAVREVREIDGRMTIRPRNRYYDEIKNILSTLIKRDIDMKTYTSIAAAVAADVAERVNVERLKNYSIDQNTFFDLATEIEKRNKKM